MGRLGDLTPEGSICIGVLVGLLSTAVQSIGLTLQRKSHILEDSLCSESCLLTSEPRTPRPAHRRRRWQLGFGMYLIANLIGSTIQITTLPLPVLSTLQASGLVFNSICATLILHEPFTRWSLGGTILVSGGAMLIAIFGAIPSPAHNLSQLLELLNRGSFLLWMAGQAALVALILGIVWVLGRESRATKPRVRLLRGLAYGCISGILSAHSLLVAKVAVELLVRTIVDGKNQFDRYQSWIILIGLVSLALTQLYFLHLGLKLVSTSVLYPLVFCVYNIIAILDGLIYFHQTSLLSPIDAGMICLGTVVLLSGVLSLSWQLSDEQSHPVVPSSALAPGLGLVDDSETEYDEFEEVAEEVEEEHRRLEGDEPMTPTSKLDTVLGATRGVRKVIRFGEEVNPWADERAGGQDGAIGYGTKVDESPDAVLPTRRQVSGPMAGTVGENTPLLLRNPSIQRRRRRRSTGFHGFTARDPKEEERKSSGHLGRLGRMFNKHHDRWWKKDGDGNNGDDSAV